MGVFARVVKEADLEAALVRREAGGHVRVAGLVADDDHAPPLPVGVEVLSLPLGRLVLVPAHTGIFLGGTGDQQQGEVCPSALMLFEQLFSWNYGASRACGCIKPRKRITYREQKHRSWESRGLGLSPPTRRALLRIAVCLPCKTTPKRSPRVHRRGLSEPLQPPVLAEKHGVRPNGDVVQKEAVQAEGLGHDIRDAGGNYEQRHLSL